MTTLVQSFLDGSSSFLQVTSPTIKAWMSFNFGNRPIIIRFHQEHRWGRGLTGLGFW